MISKTEVAPSLKPNKRPRKAKRASLVPPELLDLVLSSRSDLTQEAFSGPNGLIAELTRALLQRALEVELSHHLGYNPNETPPKDQTNRRNGASKKSLRSGYGPLKVNIPRDRDGTFVPQLVAKHQREFLGFDNKVLALYARGMTTRDIGKFLYEEYGVHVSPTLVSAVTDGINKEVELWRSRPLESAYLVVYIDALMVKTCQSGTVENRAAYVAVGLDAEGQKDVLGIWFDRTEGAKFWTQVLSELRQRGVNDVIFICADGLKGLPEAAEASFPDAVFQTCIVHVIRNSIRYVSWKDRKAVCAALKPIYMAANMEAAEAALDAFEKEWGKQVPAAVRTWRSRWAEIVPFLGYPPEIRRTIYTT
jgi:putative transposase